MKKTLLVICAILLTSCIDVKDFGTYWGKGTIDPKMAGMWEPIAVPGWDITKASKQHVVVKGDAYSITNYDNGVEKIDAPLPAKLLKIGNYDFLMSGGPTEGSLYRYKFADNVVQLFALDAVAAQKFVTAKYLNPKNVVTNAGSDSYGAAFSIKTLDDEAAKILAAIPDEDAYWKLDSSYKKQP
jgi:hypothetical protein